MQPFVFTDLPAEVRDMIYTWVFTQHENSILVRENERATDHLITATNHGRSLLRTCKAIYRESQRHAVRHHLVFTTDVKNMGYASTHQLPKLGQQLTGSLFLGVVTITVGVTDLWRVIRSLGSLETRMVRLKTIRAVVVKRMPYRYWKAMFPTVLSNLTTSTSSLLPSKHQQQQQQQQRQQQQDGLDLDPNPTSSTSLLPSSSSTIPPTPTTIPDLEHAKFRCHIRAHPMINEDEFYTDDDEDGYTDDRGDLLFPRPTNTLTERALALHVCATWVLVDRMKANEVVGVVDTKFDFTSGRILDVAVRPLETSADDGRVRHSTESLATLERQAVLQAHKR